MTLAHWDDVERRRSDIGEMRAWWRDLGGPAHTLIAGDDGLDVLAFGENADPPLVHLPRAGVLRHGGVWVLAGAEPGPLAREAAAGPLEIPAPAPRPESIAAFDDTEVDVDEKGRYAWTEHDLFHPRSRKAWVAQAFVRLDAVDDSWEGELDHGPDD